jgi:hypothetical protein
MSNSKGGAKSAVGREEVDIAENNMDDPAHQTIYGRGYDMRKRVVGEEYVAKALDGGSSDFLRPLQQYATVCFSSLYLFRLITWRSCEDGN